MDSKKGVRNNMTYRYIYIYCNELEYRPYIASKIIASSKKKKKSHHFSNLATGDTFTGISLESLDLLLKKEK